ncbi:MAG: electron transport complex subunit RsxC [Clostridiaceae bacterium]|nr:electron transport complex subunit RsxC [Clostridiales bacterium]MDD6877290.1 electron transport complex subunit RsxC [Clostridiaceae bacterium]MDY3070985.1 electron transport complex subunit RsxC [Eubacteriales bacterium]
MSASFRGGIHPEPHKESTSRKRVEVLPPPRELIFPMSMHIGVPCEPAVQKGDRVLRGQKLGDSAAFISAPVHASVSGVVTAVEKRLHSSGAKLLSVVVENDGLDTPAPVSGVPDWENAEPDALIAAIRECGIVGHGGAAFPTHAKLRSAVGPVDTLIINAAECEPYITADHRALLERSAEIVGGMRVLRRIFGQVRVCLAIEKNKPDAIALMRRAMKNDPGFEVVELETKYPQGGEKQIIRAITGREVPPGKLPSEAGCCVMNVDTSAAVWRAVAEGVPDTERIVTISGSAIAVPKNLLVRVGTPVSALVAAAGGFAVPPQKFIMGGPMMGSAQFSLDVPVLKATNAVLFFSENEDRRVRTPVCIRCGRCISVCPMRLLPTYMYMNAMRGRWGECEALNVMDCMECGACTYECPGSLHLTQTFRVAKARVIERRKK